MIDAKSAKQLYDQSEGQVQTYLDTKLDKAIKDAAAAGKRSIFHDMGSEEVFRTVEPTPIQKQIMVKLTELGYTVKFVPKHGDKYVPRGLANDNESGPSYQNYGIQINW